MNTPKTADQEKAQLRRAVGSAIILTSKEQLNFERLRNAISESELQVRLYQSLIMNARSTAAGAQGAMDQLCREKGIDPSRSFSIDDDGRVVYEGNEEEESDGDTPEEDPGGTASGGEGTARRGVDVPE